MSQISAAGSIAAPFQELQERPYPRAQADVNAALPDDRLTISPAARDAAAGLAGAFTPAGEATSPDLEKRDHDGGNKMRMENQLERIEKDIKTTQEDIHELTRGGKENEDAISVRQSRLAMLRIQQQQLQVQIREEESGGSDTQILNSDSLNAGNE